ncbi:MAG: DUF1501 domain-containing protein [Sphingobacteriales bacterium]|nr:MAG: DUF1501 domain-containing protein [Sphingobacteriales bacterium]
MDRRKFFKNSALLSVPLFLRGIPVFAGEGLMHPFLDAVARPTNSCDKILVIIQMNGGNDGLNMVIPLDRYSELSAARSNILIPQASVLSLTGSTTTGLHPSMTGLQNLYNAGKVTIVQGVSYPNPNFSHFHAQDIWFTAANSGETLDTGWLGRELDVAYPGYPDGYPNTTDQDPPAIQIGGSLAMSLQGPSVNMGYNAPNPASLLNVVNASSGTVPVSDYGTELSFMRLMKDQSNAYTSRITGAYNGQATLSTMYAASGNSLSDQLKIVARLIGGGLKTPVYIVNHPDSFDTHVSQTVTGSTTTGTHANALSKLSVAISAFQNDLTLMNKADKVTGMTFSEFGRRVVSNASTGTDHGTAAPVIFFGAGVNGGVLGSSPVLPVAPTTSTQVPTQFDFRQLYASVMQNWLCLTATQSSTVLNGTFNTIGIFNTGGTALPLSAIELRAGAEGTNARLDFNVNENEQYQKFVIERSDDATNFEESGSMRQYSDLSYDSYTYREDLVNAPTMYYRIKAITKQDGIAYSNIARIQNGSVSQQISVYPNPVQDFTLNIEFFMEVKSNIEVAIFTTGGQRLYYNQFSPKRKLRFMVPDIFESHAMYVLKVTYDHNDIVEKIVFE